MVNLEAKYSQLFQKEGIHNWTKGDYHSLVYTITVILL